MIFTTIQLQSFIVIGVLLIAVAIVGTYAVKLENEEKNRRRSRRYVRR